MNGEERRHLLVEALLGSLYFFLVLFGYYMLKPLRESYFLSAFAPTAKPYFNMGTVVILFGAATFYSWVVQRVQGMRFIRIFYGFLICNLLAFYVGFKMAPAVAGAVFYPWLSTANIFLTMVFWTQINASFTSRRAKLFYVIIGLGGGLGSAFGGRATSLIVPIIGTDNLVMTAAAVFVLAFGCAALISRRTRSNSFVLTAEEKAKASFRGLLQERYAVCILALVVIGTFVQTIFDYQLTTLVSESIGKNKDAISIFYGSLYFKQNTFSFLAQLVVGPIVLMSVGPARGLYLFLIVIFGSVAALTIQNSLHVMEWVMIVFAGSGYSFVQMFREQLYVPASNAVKVSFKGFIDTFGFRAGDTAAAVLTLVLVGMLGIDVVSLDWLVLGAGVIATYYLFHANKIYHRLERDYTERAQA